MPALNAQSAILDIFSEFSESRPNRKVVPSTPRLSFWTVLFRHNRCGVGQWTMHGVSNRKLQVNKLMEQG